MPLRYLQIIAPRDRLPGLQELAAETEAIVEMRVSEEESERPTLHLLTVPEDRQKLIDRIQSRLSDCEKWRILVLPVDAAIPKPEAEEEQEKKRSKQAMVATREELYHEVERNAQINSDFLLMVLLAVIVAAVGLIADNVTAVIGAMVIAPLLGPNVALILGSTLGDRELVLRAAGTNLVGIGLTVAIAYLIGLVVPVDLDSAELLARSDAGLDSAALALASGAAATLSVTSGLSSALVGVMVAVALMPPAVAIGLFLAISAGDLALGAGMLLAINIVCVNLAGQIAFLSRGIKPRTWLEKRAARQSILISLVTWLVAFAMLLAVILIRSR